MGKKTSNIIEKYDQKIRRLFFKRGFDHEELEKILTMFEIEILEPLDNLKENLETILRPPKPKFIEEWWKILESDTDHQDTLSRLAELIVKQKEDKQGEAKDNPATNKAISITKAKEDIIEVFLKHADCEHDVDTGSASYPGHHDITYDIDRKGEAEIKAILEAL